MVARHQRSHSRGQKKTGFSFACARNGNDVTDVDWPHENIKTRSQQQQQQQHTMASTRLLCPACDGWRDEESEAICKACMEAAESMVTQDDEEDGSDQPLQNPPCTGTRYMLPSSRQVLGQFCLDTAYEDIAPINMSSRNSPYATVDRLTSFRLVDDDERVTNLIVKLPDKVIQEKFLKACRKGESIELLLSHVPSSSFQCVIADVQSRADRISRRNEHAESEGRTEDTYTSPCLTPDSHKQAGLLESNPDHSVDLPNSPRTTQQWDLPISPESTQEGASSCVNTEIWSTPTKTSESLKRGISCGKTCTTCDNALPEEWMSLCKLCYAKKQSERNPSQGHGTCRLCTGVTREDWQQYCGKCYEAKLRDDARKKITTPLLNKLHVPFTCMDCGGEVSASWMKRCRLCYDKSPISKRPKLVHVRKY